MSTKPHIYCDHNATTPVHPDIQSSYLSALAMYGNPSSLYLAGRQSKDALESARESLAQHIGANPDQIIFTSSGTESNNQVLKHFISHHILKKDPVHIIVSAIEHSSVLSSIHVLKAYGIEVDIAPVDINGKLNIEAYTALFKPHTKLVCIVMANNEIGTIQNIAQIASIAHEHQALCHSDAVQALGKLPISTSELDTDFLSFSAHKIYAPKGVGALYVKDPLQLTPLLTGGHHERSLRASTENVPAIIAFEAAIKRLDPNAYQAHTQPLKAALKKGLSKIPDIIFNDTDDGLSNTISMSVLGLDGYGIAINCDLEGIDLSTGSACSVGSVEPSPILSAIGIPLEQNKSTLRISLGLTTTRDDIEIIIDKLTTIIRRMRQSAT